MTAPCCIVYITDEGYLFPTLMSAVQARSASSAASADVIIFHMGISRRAEVVFEYACKSERIGFAALQSSTVDSASPMLARLYMDRFLPPDCEQILYIDGDTLVGGDLDPLIRADVPPSRFLAVRDPLSFLIGDEDRLGTRAAAHMTEIGLTHEGALKYFNTGVLRINRLGWDGIGRRAADLVARSERGFDFPDQDPLNLAAVGQHAPISLAWNFPAFLQNTDLKSIMAPRVLHYMSRPKPWQGSFRPWGEAGCAPYLSLETAYPDIGPWRERMSAPRRARYHIQQWFKHVTEARSWGHGARFERLLRYEREVVAI